MPRIISLVTMSIDHRLHVALYKDFCRVRWNGVSNSLEDMYPIGNCISHRECSTLNWTPFFISAPDEIVIPSCVILMV